jgi:cytochrome c peroxidase
MMKALTIVLCGTFTLLTSMTAMSVGAPPASSAHASGRERDAICLAREQLGRQLFFDETLSEPHGTSCASCHDPRHAFSGNHGSTIGVPLGSTPGSYGLRNTPALTYASFTPPFLVDKEEDPIEPKGGQFLDGRANFLDDQAEGPLLSPLEMNNPDRAAVVAKVARSYAAEFRAAFGADIFSRGVDRTFLAVGAALQAFESSAVFHPFSSRFDRFRAGTLALDAAEARGMKLFFDPLKGNCMSCHVARVQVARAVVFFTDFGYETLGVPRNPRIPANADPAFFDLGLGGPKRSVPRSDQSFNGAFRTPSLRNVAVKQAFMHNGCFTRLEDVIAFYATRDTDPYHWYPHGAKFNDTPAAYQEFINGAIPFGRHPGEAPPYQGQEIADLVAFLRALTDQEFEAALPPAGTPPAIASPARALAPAPSL